MTDHTALLQAIAADPENDLPRWIYADYLEEHDEPARAEFIRAQLEQASRPPEDPVAVAAARRADELWTTHSQAWRLPWPGIQLPRRGILEHIETSAEAVARTKSRTAHWPMVVIRQLRLVNVDLYLESLRGLPFWSTLESLTLNNGFLGSQDRLTRLFQLGSMPRLRDLVLQNNRLWPECLPAIFQAPIASQLECLNLSGNPLGDAGLIELSETPALPRLRQLILRSDELPYAECIHAPGAAALAASPYRQQLQWISLAGQSIGDAGAIDLAESGPLAATLQYLDLSFNDLGVLGELVWEALTNPYRLPQLETLSLRGNRVTELAAEALLNDWPPGLKQIDLRDCEFEGQALRRLQPMIHEGRFLVDPAEFYA